MTLVADEGARPSPSPTCANQKVMLCISVSVRHKVTLSRLDLHGTHPS